MNKFNIGVIPRLLLFAILSAAASTPLQLFNSIFIEKLEGPPSFVSVPFLVYAVSMKIVFGLGYVLFGHKLPIRNNILRAFSYIMLIFFSSYLPNILAMAGGNGEIIGASFSVNIVMIDTISYLMDGLILGLVGMLTTVVFSIIGIFAIHWVNMTFVARVDTESQLLYKIKTSFMIEQIDAEAIVNKVWVALIIAVVVTLVCAYVSAMIPYYIDRKKARKTVAKEYGEE